MRKTSSVQRIAASKSLEKIDEAVIARFRNSKTEAIKELRESGAAAGICYADDHAHYIELSRLHQWEAKTRNDLDLNLEDFGPSGLADVLAGKDGPSDEILDVIRELGGVDVENGDWLESFIAAALKRFEQIEAKL